MRSDMKRLALAALAAALPLSLQAAPPVDMTAIRAYVSKALVRCPDPKLKIDPILQTGPTNFFLYDVTLESSDQNCSTHKYMLYSPTTQQIILGTVLQLPQDSRPVAVRITEQTSDSLKVPVTTNVSPFPVPDGLKPVSITKNTKYGPFNYHAFVDASERFLSIGTRGNLREDPGKTLLDAIGAQNAVRRGSKASKVQIIELSDFECPSCGRAHKKIEPLISKNLSKISYGRLDLPLFEHHEWAVPAALGARAIQSVAPSKYWEYANYLFENQEKIGTLPSFDKFFQEWIEDHEIDWKKIAPIYNSPTERAQLLDQVSRAFDNGINSTPTFIINGQPMGFGPDGQYTVDAIKKAIGGKK